MVLFIMYMYCLDIDGMVSLTLFCTWYVFFVRDMRCHGRDIIDQVYTH